MLSRPLGEAEFYPGETCESEIAAGHCENRKSRLFSALQFFDHSGGWSTSPKALSVQPIEELSQTGDNQAWMFTDINVSTSPSMSVKGGQWHRSDDTVGLADVVDTWSLFRQTLKAKAPIM